MSTHTHAYPATQHDTFVAKVERAQLCDLFEELGPEAPTLSGDWDTGELRVASKKGRTVVVVGPPSELALFA
ncbi:MAG: hypothetical protein WKF54_09365 [Nocardioidaceae bacterium]